MFKALFMANCGKEILLEREGTEQNQRFIKALDPGFFKLNAFELKDWMKFAYHFAKHVNYFSSASADDPSGNWEEFFKSDAELETFLEGVEEGKSVTPHLALFVSFVKLLGFSQKRFNNLTKRHLDFYYRHILKIEKLPATPDKVHLIFELAKNSVEEKIAEGTELDGEKDANGTKRIYKIQDELIANKIKVAALKSVYNDHVNNKLKAASQANSYDGAGGDFPDDDVKWWPFGYYEKPPGEPEVDERKYPELPDAILGFAVSGEILELQEGERNVQLTVEFDSALSNVSQSNLTEQIEIYCSGEKGWLGPFTPREEIDDEDGETIFSTELKSAKKKVTLAFQIPKDDEAVVKYDPEVLGENFSTKFPVCRVLFKMENPGGHSLYREFVENEVKLLTVDVDVRAVKSVLLESDIGTLNPEKPFYPFGTQPVKNSNFYIDYPELFKKEWTNLNVNFDWKNTPDSFRELYYAYRESYRYRLTQVQFLDIMGDYSSLQKMRMDAEELMEVWKKNDLTEQILGDTSGFFSITDNDLIVENDSHFEAKVEIQNREEWQTTEPSLTLFISEDSGFKGGFSVDNDGFETDKNGPVRLSLKQSFLHELFPRIYATAFSSEEKGSLIPNEPYTPMAENVLLSYSAQTSAKFGESQSSENELMLFHEHPFGQSEQHIDLKNQLDFLSEESKKIVLVPTYCEGGELYIGLENAKNLQTVSLLVQVLEGSENPEADSFIGKQKVEWSVLCSNEWKTFDSNYMIANETDNFLKSGIVKFSIPKEATTKHSRLPSGKIWVKAKIHKKFDAVCKAISIHAQAATAEFENNNDLAHLENGLPAETISKLVQRLSSVKSVSQPYSSFGGKPEESDAKYYRRISERLRHKNRAITLWDYEHLILQQFSEIHKVKCLNHTSDDSFLAPGDVQLVVIPDIVNQNVFDIYQPRVSKATLNKIQDFVNKLNTLHVNAVVINPEYEEITVDLKVKFHSGFDENFYKKVLNDDITKLLSPWAFEKTAGIQFGVVLHRSVIINYIEKLDYVDYLKDVILKKGTEAGLKNVAPSSPRAILVSAKKHNIVTDFDGCKTVPETQEKCQT